jgi:hypothetical protein
MNLEPGAIYGGIGAVGAIVGWIIRGTRTFAGKEKELETLQRDLAILTKLYDALQADMGRHHQDRDIHIDPRRDAATMQGLRDLVAQGFEAIGHRQAEMMERLDRIDSRCETRGKECAEHFSKVKERIAAATGRTNGWNDDD